MQFERLRIYVVTRGNVMTETKPDFGKTAADYGKYRQGFPPAFFEKLPMLGVPVFEQQLLDLGTGTGTIARGLALRGASVTALDPSAALLAQAQVIDRELGITAIHYVQAKAEATQLPAQSFDAVFAGQCWHWFDAEQAIPEVRRVTKPGGKLVISHLDWLPLPGTVAELSEALIVAHNPDGHLGLRNSTGFYPLWVNQLLLAGFDDIITTSFEVLAEYTHEAWCGRVRASADVAASLTPEAVNVFDETHAAALTKSFPSAILKIPHRCFIVVATVTDTQPSFSCKSH